MGSKKSDRSYIKNEVWRSDDLTRCTVDRVVPSCSVDRVVLFVAECTLYLPITYWNNIIYSLHDEKVEEQTADA
jgi:hypothetical protein